MNRSTWTCFALALVGACTDDARPSIVASIRSSLRIPTETNSMTVRVLEGRTPILEEGYGLGEDPRDQWPQTLPLVRGPSGPESISLSIELRNQPVGAPSEAVGFAIAEAKFPESGSTQIDILVPRSCLDDDGDEYGIGPGCLGFDCDETRGDVPDPVACTDPPDAGFPDAGPDAGFPDGGPEDAGPDAGIPDIDAGPPDAGGTVCDTQTCTVDQVCFAGRCLDTCMEETDCFEGYACIPSGVGRSVCVCFRQCTDACGPFECLYGCCQF